jgi:DNA-binding LacI/PurR family transcriptional regulator
MAADVVEELTHSGIRTVVSGVAAMGANVCGVRVECSAGMRRLVEHLAVLGHRRVAFIGHHAGLESIGERRRAFEESVRGLESRAFTDADDSLEGGRQAVRDLLASGFHATAAVCVNDHMALGALSELRMRGWRVPQDISVTGFDNTGISEAAYPALTTVHIPRERVARLVFETLVSESAPARDLTVSTELVLRDSTGPAPRGRLRRAR